MPRKARDGKSIADLSMDPLLSMPAVKSATTLSKATIYRKVEDGSFPRPLKIGKSRVAWRQSAIAQWIAEAQPTASRDA